MNTQVKHDPIEDGLLVLSEDQQAAYDEIVQFLLDPNQPVMVLEGYAGTGKSTLISKFLNDIPKISKVNSILDPDSENKWDIVLTATTNKAAEALEHISNRQVITVYSLFGLIPMKNFQTNKTTLIRKNNVEWVTNKIIVIDEASFVDSELLDLIFRGADNCKILFIGDPSQLLMPTTVRPPVFSSGFPTAKLTKVVRQAEGNPIIELATAFRTTVNTGEFFSFRPDGQAIAHLPMEEFLEKIQQEFCRPDWRNNDSKVLAWTNKTVIAYNEMIRKHVQGEPQLQTGDYAVCNSFVSKGGYKLRTDQLVYISHMVPSAVHGIPGFMVEVDRRETFFLPATLQDRRKAINEAKANENYSLIKHIEETWIDLRAAYACTINKSQGSTYDKVFIDLNDVKNCRSNNTVARLLYVATSRARTAVYLTGDLV